MVAGGGGQRSRAAHVEILALIPARGGSKSIPRKNLRLLAGKPLIVHSIDQAIRSEMITRVVVSTEDDEVAEVARSSGADIPFLRPPGLAADDTPDLPVFRHALTWLRDHERYAPQVVVQLRPTSPLRQIETMDRAIRQFLAHPEVDSLRSVSVAKQNPYKMWRIGERRYLEPVVRLADGVESWNMPRQALPRAYWQNGYIDMTRPDVIVQRGTMSGTRILSFVIDEPCVEIDYEDQLRLAEHLIEQARTGRSTPVAIAEQFPS